MSVARKHLAWKIQDMDHQEVQDLLAVHKRLSNGYLNRKSPKSKRRRKPATTAYDWVAEKERNVVDDGTVTFFWYGVSYRYSNLVYHTTHSMYITMRICLLVSIIFQNELLIFVFQACSYVDCIIFINVLFILCGFNWKTNVWHWI